MAVELKTRTESDLGVHVPVAAIFEAADLAAFADLILPQIVDTERVEARAGE